jgi:hypothetical protein
MQGDTELPAEEPPKVDRDAAAELTLGPVGGTDGPAAAAAGDNYAIALLSESVPQQTSCVDGAQVHRDQQFETMHGKHTPQKVSGCHAPISVAEELPAPDPHQTREVLAPIPSEPSAQAVAASAMLSRG